MLIVGQVDQTIDAIEDFIFDRPTPRTLEQLFGLKRVLLTMRRILLPQREVLNKLARDDYLMIDPKDRIFFRDIYDHIVRLHDLNESLRDLVSRALDTYLSVINNRMNEVMKTLTIITTLFMPLSFIAGFFGMNLFFAQYPRYLLDRKNCLLCCLGDHGTNTRNHVLLDAPPYLDLRAKKDFCEP